MKSLIVFFSIILASCSILNSGNIAPGYKEAFKAIRGVVLGYDNEFLSREIIDNIPYASSSLQIGKGTPGLIILESLQQKKETWISADGVYIVVSDGKIVQTAGLENNLKEIKLNELNLKKFIAKGVKESRISYYSYDSPKLTDLKVYSTFTLSAKETIEIYGIKKQLHKVEEQINNDYIGWSKKNVYWADDEGFVWKSRQYISPRLPIFYLEVTKKPAY